LKKYFLPFLCKTIFDCFFATLFAFKIKICIFNLCYKCFYHFSQINWLKFLAIMKTNINNSWLNYQKYHSQYICKEYHEFNKEPFSTWSWPLANNVRISEKIGGFISKCCLCSSFKLPNIVLKIFNNHIMIIMIKIENTKLICIF